MSEIFDKYVEFDGGEFFGEPISQETAASDGIGRYRHFERGSIYWTPQTGAHVVSGHIREKWKSLGWECSKLGYPITDQLSTPIGIGKYNDFERGTIYWDNNKGVQVKYQNMPNSFINEQRHRFIIATVLFAWVTITLILLLLGQFLLVLVSFLTMVSSIIAYYIRRLLTGP